MAKTLGVVSRKTLKKLMQFDYGNLYSIHNGSNLHYWEEDDAVEIFVSVNRYGRLYIVASIAFGEHIRTFDFDNLDRAVDWIRRRVEVVG